MQFSLRKVVLTTVAVGGVAGGYALLGPDSTNTEDKAKAARPGGGQRAPAVVKVLAMEPASLAQTLLVTGCVLANEEV